MRFPVRPLSSVMCVLLTGIPVTAGIDDLSWMAGRWSGTQGATFMEEHWMPPRGGIMLGLHRDTRESRPAFFEFLRIEEKEDGIFYIASPRGAAGTPFRLTSNELRRAVFENPDHDFPQKIMYWLGEDGALHAKIEGPRDGKTASTEWRWEPAEAR